MRLPKFKAKRLDNGEWIYGFVIPSYIIEIEGVKQVIYCMVEENKLGDLQILYSGRMKTGITFGVPIDKETIREFTGKLDCNNQEVYEGDIVKITVGIAGYESTYNTYISEVKYLGQAFTPLNNSEILKLELLGNTLDNSELIKR